MADLYHSQRSTNKPDSTIGLDFWCAFTTYLKRLTNDNYFTKEFPDSCGDGHPIGCYDSSLESRLREELGQITWPIQGVLPKTELILDLLEFFFQHVAKPTKQWHHSYCGGLHPEEYDVAKGRYDYTVKINSILGRFNHPYQLRKGRVIRKSSEFLDAPIMSLELSANDEHLAMLMETALANFYDKTGTKKLQGLQGLVDAFDRLKTIEDDNKKKSVTKVIGRLSPFDEIRGEFDSHFRKVTELSNKYTIRHHERDKIQLLDPDLIEYLFYGYYNLIRLILQKYGFLDHRQ